jgi:hypothetical protein
MMGGMFQHAMGGGPPMAMQGPFSGFPFGGMMQGGDNGAHTNTDMNMQQQQQPQQQQFRSEVGRLPVPRCLLSSVVCAKKGACALPGVN